MNDTPAQTTPDTPRGATKPRNPDEVSPDQLMNDFRGRPIVMILIVTVIAHAIFIGIFSVGYIKREFIGEDTTELSDEERMDQAITESTASLQEIADRHNVPFQSLKSRFTDGAAAPAEPADTPSTPPPADERERSEYEQNLTQDAPAPATPDLGDEGLGDDTSPAPNGLEEEPPIDF